jgi:hypothetical protein
MTDQNSKKRLQVELNETAGPYIRLPLSLLGDVRKLLDDRGIRYRVHGYATSINGGPEMTYIFLGRDGDARAVQAVLDSAA